MQLAVGGRRARSRSTRPDLRPVAPPGPVAEALVATREHLRRKLQRRRGDRPSGGATAGAGLLDMLLDNPAVFMAGILLAMWLILSRLSPYFFTLDNLFEITIQAAVIALIAVGQTFVILSGGIDLSVGAVLAATERRRLDRDGPRLRSDRRHRRRTAVRRGVRRRQRHRGRQARHPAVHRDARHDGHRPRLCPDRHRGHPGVQSRARLRGAGPGSGRGHHPGADADHARARTRSAT